MKLSLAALFIALCAWALPNAALAQSTPSKLMYMTIHGPDGDILGEITQQGRVGWHALQAYSHEIISPRDAASGLPTGKRQHKPFSIVKLVNRGSPLLLTAMTKNQPLEVEVSLWGQSQVGQEVKVLTYRLIDAQVVAIRPWMPNKNDTATQNYNPAEEISFTYRTIEVTFVNGGITAQDDWEAPVADPAKDAKAKR